MSPPSNQEYHTNPSSGPPTDSLLKAAHATSRVRPKPPQPGGTRGDGCLVSPGILVGAGRGAHGRRWRALRAGHRLPIALPYWLVIDYVLTVSREHHSHAAGRGIPELCHLSNLPVNRSRSPLVIEIIIGDGEKLCERGLGWPGKLSAPLASGWPLLARKATGGHQGGGQGSWPQAGWEWRDPSITRGDRDAPPSQAST